MKTILLILCLCQVRLPDLPPNPNPEPEDVKPVPVTDLKAGELFVIAGEEPCRVEDSRQGIISIKRVTGPREFYGKFVDGKVRGEDEERTYTEPFLYIIRAVKPGSVELLITPKSYDVEQESLRRTLTVMGNGPNPPPPDPDPKPDPKPEPVPTGKVFVAVVEDAMNRSPDASIVLGALIGWHSWLDKGNTYRFYDQSTGESKGKKAMADSEGLPVPYMVIYNEKGEKLRAAPLPTTFAKLKEVLGGT